MAVRPRPRGFNPIRPFVQPVSAGSPLRYVMSIDVVLEGELAAVCAREAAERGIRPAEIVNSIVKLVLRDRLVAAVLDK